MTIWRQSTVYKETVSGTVVFLESQQRMIFGTTVKKFEIKWKLAAGFPDFLL
ncbi:hypothetical protein Mal48_42700 [Thalassoglobus polymorphus]|uniref:Uncharacterized protein n=1 Tax=Thalassoglobus polymorphus TaxID=2527994 RepID=A0A517QTX5_9PLAN|nr:hypothetical protein Mal48_42700 [Thalassoglobus polymorphus]